MTTTALSISEIILSSRTYFDPRYDRLRADLANKIAYAITIPDPNNRSDSRWKLISPESVAFGSLELAFRFSNVIIYSSKAIDLIRSLATNPRPNLHFNETYEAARELIEGALPGHDAKPGFEVFDQFVMEVFSEALCAWRKAHS